MQGRSRAFTRNRQSYGLLSAALAALALGACTTTQSATTHNATNAAYAPTRNTTVAFEMIDGPPPAVFTKLVQKLNDEAKSRQMPVVTREGFANYRIRGYVAAGIEKKKKRAVITWVWDVYDAEQRRAFRITGEEEAPRASGDAWAAADDQLLSKLARNGMTQLASYLQAPPAEIPSDAPAATTAASPERASEVVAMAPAN